MSFAEHFLAEKEQDLFLQRIPLGCSSSSSAATKLGEAKLEVPAASGAREEEDDLGEEDEDPWAVKRTPELEVALALQERLEQGFNAESWEAHHQRVLKRHGGKMPWETA